MITHDVNDDFEFIQTHTHTQNAAFDGVSAEEWALHLHRHARGSVWTDDLSS